MTEIWERGQQLCSRSDAHFGSISGNYARQFCFSVPYLASLIEDGLCLGDAEINFGPGDVSWTLGAALVEGEYLWLSLLLIVYCSQIKLPMPGKRDGVECILECGCLKGTGWLGNHLKLCWTVAIVS
ncbi:hypothetical protein CK203_006468 [Vitis vinifera]|uniref:Uncharacterized protein n=1 Tax=Vitis vinifera TaxID=29760 RepID=A0A438KBW1_VITVI|nr:hypothetical protein CK203_006468 [Vitis vinifera]